MTARQRALLALHGSILVVIALLTGFMAVIDTVDGARGWRSVHQTLLVFGAWTLATAGAAPAIRLAPREARALVWALASSGYAMVLVLIVRASTGVTGFEFGPSIASRIAFLANMVVTLGAFLAALLTLIGAWNALRSQSEIGAG
jgi:hypothetical protein